MTRAKYGLLLLPLFLFGMGAACDPDPRYGDPIRSEFLSVVPSTSSGSNTAGSIYSDASVDPYLNGAYVLRDIPNFRLKAINASPAGDNRLALHGNTPVIADDVNCLQESWVVISVNDPAKLNSLLIGGVTITSASFTHGAPDLDDGAPFTSGQRLPGYFARAKISGIKAGQSLLFDVSVSAKPEIELHFDVYGDTWGGRVFVSGERSGTTYITSAPIPTYALSVAKAGSGTGKVASNPAGISCGDSCQAIYVRDTAVVLTATADGGSRFTGWSGACSGTSATCTIAMTAAKNATANFERLNYSFSVSKSGTGSGTVSSAAGISCGATCAANVAHGSTITLTASASASSTFTGWSGACTNTDATCTVTVTDVAAVSANFDLKSFAFTVGKTGSAQGRITSLPAGIDCGEQCEALYSYGTEVTLTATPAAGATFKSWSGACAAVTAPTCTVTMTDAANVSAQFDPAIFSITVTKSGIAGGTISSIPAGISCGASCSGQFQWGTSLTLTATPDAGSVFTGWSGACSGTGPCVIIVGSDDFVNANFDVAKFTFSVTTTGNGGGWIISSPAGIDCPSECSAQFDYGTSVTLIASPDSASDFSSWSGACAGTVGPACVVTVDGAKSVSATFTPKPVVIPPPTFYTVSVTRTGNGSGTVASSPSGIECGANCSANFGVGDTITLIASASTHSEFAGWTGACSGTSPICNVTADAAKYVGAVFNLENHQLSIVKTGAGTITSTDGGINCGSDCQEIYACGTTITLTANTDRTNPYNVFTGWSGGCSGSELSCTLPVNDPTSIGATFEIISQIKIALNASKIYDGSVETWGTFRVPQPANLKVPGTITLNAGNTGNHVAAVDFFGTVCCYKGANTVEGRTYLFNKCINGSSFGGAHLNSLQLFDACKSNQTPTNGMLAGSTVHLNRGNIITLLVENDDNRNPPVGSPNYQAIVQVVIDVLAWFQ